MVWWWGSSDEETNLDDSSGEITVGHFLLLISRPDPRCYYYYCNCNYFFKIKTKVPRTKTRTKTKTKRARFRQFLPFLYCAIPPFSFLFLFLIFGRPVIFSICFGLLIIFLFSLFSLVSGNC